MSDDTIVQASKAPVAIQGVIFNFKKTFVGGGALRRCVFQSVENKDQFLPLQILKTQLIPDLNSVWIQEQNMA